MNTIDVSAFVTPDTVDVTGALGKHLGTGWTLIGGMMVAIHLARHGRRPLRLTRDADIVVDVRTVIDPPLLRRATSALNELGFEPQPHANERGETVCHRFLRDTVAVDLLAPEGLRDSDQTLGTLPGARTIQAPGGTQALRRSSVLHIQSGSVTAEVRMPSLLGSLVIKACAISVSDHAEDQERDVAALLTLVADPDTMRAEIDAQKPGPRRTDLRRLRTCKPLTDPTHRGWQGIAARDRDLGRATLQTLIRH